MQKWRVRSVPRSQKINYHFKNSLHLSRPLPQATMYFYSDQLLRTLSEVQKTIPFSRSFLCKRATAPAADLKRPLAPMRLSPRTVIFFYRNQLFRPRSEAKKSISISTGRSVETCGRPRDRSQATALTSASVASNCYIFL